MPGLLSSPVCLTVIWFLSWSLHPSCAQIQSDEVSGTQYGALDSNVTLACGNSQIGVPVVWHHNHSSALLQHMVTSDGSLVLLHVNHSAQGRYSCYDDRGLLLHSVNLRLGRLPGLLIISCQVPNHTYVRCSWVDSVRTFLPAKYNASIRGIGMEWRPCVVDIARKHCALDRPAYWQMTHTLRVTETNALGFETTFLNFRLNELLKPNPPESLLVKEQEGHPKRLIVSWSIPSSWPPHVAFPLLFHIRYRPQGSVYWSEMYTEERQAVILDALAGHIHEVQVRARDAVDSESQWSEWSPLYLVKPWEGYTTPYPDDEEEFPDYIISIITTPENSTEKSHNPELEDEGNLGLVILLVLFSVVILTTVLSLIFVLWMRQRRRDNGTKQELTSMVKMKAMPI